MKFAVAPAAILLLLAALPAVAQAQDNPPPPPPPAAAGDAGASPTASPMDGLREWCKEHRGSCRALRTDHEAVQSVCQGQSTAPDQMSDACRQAHMKVKADMETLRAAGAPMPQGPGMRQQPN